MKNITEKPSLLSKAVNTKTEEKTIILKDVTGFEYNLKVTKKVIYATK